LALVTRRLFLIIPPVAVVAASIGAPRKEGSDFEVPPLAGAHHASGAPVKGFRHSQLKGWVTIVHALNSARPECRDEVALWREFSGDERFQLAGFFVRDNEQDARNFIADTGNPYDALGFDVDGRAASLFGLRDAPSTLVLNARAEVVHALHGPMTREHFEGKMLPIIEASSPLGELVASVPRRFA
jgi:cytochrome c biogenesis protein CcmG/thiol:disulfide interchange protein DsbE